MVKCHRYPAVGIDGSPHRELSHYRLLWSDFNLQELKIPIKARTPQHEQVTAKKMRAARRMILLRFLGGEVEAAEGHFSTEPCSFELAAGSFVSPDESVSPGGSSVGDFCSPAGVEAPVGCVPGNPGAGSQSGTIGSGREADLDPGRAEQLAQEAVVHARTRLE